MTIRLDKPNAHDDDACHKDQERKPEFWRHPLEHQVGRKLRDDIEDEKDAECNGILVVVEVEVCCEAQDFGISDI